jgi:hypothetical protein
MYKYEVRRGGVFTELYRGVYISLRLTLNRKSLFKVFLPPPPPISLIMSNIHLPFAHTNNAKRDLH